jgi:hypothetical protein
MHILETTLIHYANPKAQAIVYVQAYSFWASIKKFDMAGKTVAVTKQSRGDDDNSCGVQCRQSRVEVKFKMIDYNLLCFHFCILCVYAHPLSVLLTCQW